MTEDLTPKLPANVVVVVPCYNAGARVRPVVEHLVRLVPNVIVVDDGSTDGCVAELKALPIRIVTFPRNRGKGHALIAGYRAALENPAITCVASVDADGQHDPAELPGLYAAFERENADFLIGSRQFGGAEVPWRSRFGNTLTAAIVGKLLKANLPDTQSGFRLLSRRFLEGVLPDVSGGGYEFEMELMVRAVRQGYRVVPAPIRTIYETGNPSSHFHKFRDSWRIYKTLLRVSMRVARRG